MKKFLQSISVYVFWLLILAVGAWVFFLGRETFTGLLRTYFVGESFSRGYQAGFYDKAFTISIGLAWLVLSIVSEEQLRRKAEKGSTLGLFSRYMGVECLLAFLLDGIMLIFLSNIALTSWGRWALLSAELVFGVLFTFLGWSKRSPWYQTRKPGML